MVADAPRPMYDTNDMKLRTILIILLFAVLAALLLYTARENVALRQQTQRQAALIQQTVAEKRALEQSTAHLAAESERMRKEKTLYVATIETLEKKETTGQYGASQ